MTSKFSCPKIKRSILKTNWKNLSLYSKIVIIITFIILFSSYPYVFNRIIYLPDEQIISIACLLILIVSSIIFKKKIRIPVSVQSLCIIQIVTWFLFFLYHSDTSYLVRIFYLILTFMIIGLLNSTQSIKQFVWINNTIIAIQAVFAALGFVLVFIGVLNTVGVFTNTDGRQLDWFIITCSNTHMGNFIRASGYFDEPGALAYWGIFALLFNRLFFKNKIIEFSLLIGLLFTFSAAYFIQIIFYLLFFYSSNKKNLLIILLFGLICLIAFQLLNESEIFTRLTIDRFSGGEIKSERTELAEIAKGYFMNSPLMGIGAKNMENIGYMADNQYEILAKDGLIGAFITYLPYIYLCIKNRTRKIILLATFILGLGYLQRPFHINELHYLMMYLYVTMTLVIYDKQISKNHDRNCLLQCS